MPSFAKFPSTGDVEYIGVLGDFGREWRIGFAQADDPFYRFVQDRVLRGAVDDDFFDGSVFLDGNCH